MSYPDHIGPIQPFPPFGSGYPTYTGGWIPVFAVRAVGERRLVEVLDWVDGVGPKPATGYLGENGIVNATINAVDVRGTIGLPGGKGDQGDQGDRGLQGGNGWTPVYVAEEDNERRVLRIYDWIDGEGVKPATGYLGPLGVVPNKYEAVNLRGSKGDKGDKGDAGDEVELQKTTTHIQWRYTGGAWTNLVLLDDLKGDKGDEVEMQVTGTHIQWRVVGGSWADLISLSALTGVQGDAGWSPILASVADGTRFVFEITDWTGGAGPKPALGYIGPSGIVTTKAAAVDVRGPAGTGDVNSVNSVLPDGSGNVTLGTADIPTLATTLAGKVDKVSGKGLSANDYTTTEKNKLDGVAAGATNTAAPVQSDWNAVSGLAFIENKPGNATTSVAGFMTGADKTKLDGVAAGATNTAAPVQSDWNAVSGLAFIENKPGNATTSVAGFMTGADKTKLDGVAAGATANDTDINLKTRSNHTGTQPASSISGLHAVATSGSYNDLENKPSIPTLPATVGQTEAEEGTATTVRMWTSQRVRQAIASYAPSKSGVGTNAQGNRTVSTGNPSGGSNGDIWLKV